MAVPAGPVFDAFAEVPRAFWAHVHVRALAGMIDCQGRLTFAEREHLWDLLGNRGEPPRHMRIAFDPVLLLQASAAGPLAEARDSAMQRLLVALQGGRRGGS